MTDLQDQVATITRRLESLEQQNADLRAQLAGEESTRERRRFDRRGLLRLGGAAAAVGAGSVLLRPGVAGATTGAMQFGQDNDAGAASTGLTSSISDPTNPVDTLHVTNSSTGTDSANAAAIVGRMTDLASEGPAIVGVNDGLSDAIVGVVTSTDISAVGAGVVGYGIDFGGVIGVSYGGGPGVGGLPYGSGPGVSGWSSSGADGMEAINDGVAPTAGRALYSHVDDPSNSKQAVYALTVGTGNAVLGHISHASSTIAAVEGTTTGKGPGIEGISSHGYGGRFTGAVQMRLVPTGASSHPSTGSAGAFYVDSHGRLWYCYATNRWKQLA
jgi:hypothetical protein